MEKEIKYPVEFPKEGCLFVPPGQTVLEAALSAGVPLFHICGGNAKCSTCRVLVIEGNDYLSPPNAKEQLLKRQMNFPPNVRLACQTNVNGGPVKLRRIIQDETDIGLYVGNAAGASTQQLGEEKELVLFFLDIRNFTPLVESHLAFDVIHIVRKLFSVFQSIIESDGIYAVFGQGCDSVKAAQSAVQSAHSIVESLEGLNTTYFSVYFQENIQVGVGIHMGRVISGSVRIGAADHTIVMGLPVNVAARLQSATKELNNNIIVSKAIHDLLLHASETPRPLPMMLKVVSEPLTVYPIGKPFV